MATLPDIKLSYGVSKDIAPRVLMANLGDGYKQRAVDGINSMPEKWELTWENISDTDADTLDNFFTTYAGADSFDWTAPRASSSSKYICSGWKRTISYFQNDTITATFEQVWDY